MKVKTIVNYYSAVIKIKSCTLMKIVEESIWQFSSPALGN